MATRIQFRRGTSSQHASFTGAVGEMTVDTDKDVVVVHDGSTAGGFEMLRADLNNIAGPVGTSNIADSAITTAKINNDAVTNDKLSLSANAGEIKKALNANNNPEIFACRAWVNFNGEGTVSIRADGGFSSISDLGTGHYNANFSTAMPDANYQVSATIGDQDLPGPIGENDYFIWTADHNTSNIKVALQQPGDSNRDYQYVELAVHR